MDDSKAQAALVQAIKDQMASPETQYVKEHYDRLTAAGEDEQEVLQLMGAVLAYEMWEMSTQGREFDEAGYQERLGKLPDLSWMDEGA